MELIEVGDRGFHCVSGGFSIDPLKPVEEALITHAHADHARGGSQSYTVHEDAVPVLRHRLGNRCRIRGVKYGERVKMGKTWVSFHPAGHILGSSQIRVERGDDVWVVSGDYKRAEDPTCPPLEPVACSCFVTEATFGLPVYAWRPGTAIAEEIARWWDSYREGPSLLFCYALGKTQRVLAELAKISDRPVHLHGASFAITELYRERGITLPETRPVSAADSSHAFRGELVITPASAHRSVWMKRYKNPQTAFVSGWMHVRGTRRRWGYERGFTLSDHADWQGILDTVRQTGASRVLVSHGHETTVSRYLREQWGIDARPLGAAYDGQVEDG
jgi:putative mRNA 3-end processing factor